MNTYHIHIKGQVQGVGFRPFVYKLARRFGLTGWVNNTIDGVHVELNASPEEIDVFYEQIIARAPALSRITHHDLFQVEDKDFDQFRIIKSEEAGEAELLLTPDFALCPDCRRELLKPDDRRHLYAFITCTNCGPRFSVVRELPYDRERTTMLPFVMCPTCQAEYDDPLDRRYYSQTNSCTACGMELAFLTGEKRMPEHTGSAALEATVAAINRGEIVAVKGIGGFLLLCDATDPAAIDRLRQRKHRPSKPFAVLYPNLEMLACDAVLPDEARRVLVGSVAPIVLLDTVETPPSRLAMPQVAPGLRRVGAMIPYTPLYELLMQALGRPVVATSGNISNTPILYEENSARRDLPAVADYMLTHNRDIAIPQDDSVVRFTPQHRRRIIIRRSRGLAPTFILPGMEWPEESLVATGASLKSAFALLQRGNVYISQYLGDLDNYDTQAHYRHTLDHFLRLFKARPARLLADLHPDYFSTRLAQERAQVLKVPILYVQHHLAHFAAVLGEHRLIDTAEPVLGVIWDGTGYGADGKIWGGEFFLYRDYHFERHAHLSYYPHLAGDKMPREPRLSALAVAHDAAGAEVFLRGKFTVTEWGIYQQLLSRERGVQTSSMGRLFDAVASLLGLADRTTYEGEAAMRLEQLAEDYLQRAELTEADDYGCRTATLREDIVSGILRDLAGELPPALIAARFHFSLIRSVLRLADELHIRYLALSGGVWQNGLLVDLLMGNKRETTKLLFHRELSPNDECISFGQLVYDRIASKAAKKNKQKIIVN